MRDMRRGRLGSALPGLWLGVVVVALMGISGCQHLSPGPNPPTLVAGQPEPDQRVFASAEDAAKALIQAATDGNTNEVDRIFGPATRQEMLSGDPVEDRRGFERFAQRVQEGWRAEKLTERQSILHVGERDWPFPIPIVQGPDGKWFFDTASGKAEILARRIGRNELANIEMCRAFVEAQREYASEDRDGSGVLKYARHYWSTPGTKDGLYWEAAPGEEQSPAGAMVAKAISKGYTADQSTTENHPYRGYFFQILTQQGPQAPGGRYDYVVNGNMIAGFALVASPAKYGSSGIMTFIINHHGVLYEKDLGPHTPDIVQKMTAYNPDSTWHQVKD